VASAPREIELSVRLSARGVPAEQLRQLVEDTRRCSVVLCALEDRVPVLLRVEVGES
jgi:hypothetical protein